MRRATQIRVIEFPRRRIRALEKEHLCSLCLYLRVSLFFSLPSSKRERESRFAPFHAYREPTFDLVLEDRLPSCVSRTLAFECNSIVYETMGRSRTKSARGKGGEGWYRNAVLKTWPEARETSDASDVQLCALRQALSQTLLGVSWYIRIYNQYQESRKIEKYI